MQTFIPFPDIEASLTCLDFARLRGQRKESSQLLNILLGKTPNSSWKNHPACKMWANNIPCLIAYYNAGLEEWARRGFKNIILQPISGEKLIYPDWWGGPIHASHRSNLLRKNFEHYSQFGWTESADLPYVWPTGTK